MKFISIFVDDTEGLHSVHYDEEEQCEYDRLFDLWFDREYLLNFCKENQNDIFSDFWGTSKLEFFVEEIIDEVNKLYDIMMDFEDYGFIADSNMLDKIFLPLNNREYFVPDLQETKAKVDHYRPYRRPKLRLYALRFNKNTFLLTGGCIKLVHRMEESVHTQHELNKLNIVRDFCLKNDYRTQDDLAYYYEQQ